MQLSDKQIKEFQRIYEKEKGEKISKKEATEATYNLIGFFKLLYDCARKQGKLKEFRKNNISKFYG